MEQHILYVEDDDLSREVMSLIIEDLPGFALTVFPDSVDFIEKLQHLPTIPNLILLDIHVQPLDGFSMLNLLRETEVFQNIPVVALTASVMNEEVTKLRQAGFHGAIAKPVDPDFIAEQVKEILKGRSIWTISQI